MYKQVEKSKENKSRAVANSVAQKKSNGKQGFGLVDNRPEVIAQRMRQEAKKVDQIPARPLDSILKPLQKEGAEDMRKNSYSSSLIVEDSISDLSFGQEKKSKFLERLYQKLHSVGTEAYQGTNLIVEGCPYIMYWFNRYKNEKCTHIEHALKKYAKAPSVTSVEELIHLVCQRAKQGFEKQVETGKITELPEDIPMEAGKGIVPEPDQIVQRKLETNLSSNYGKQDPIQRLSISAQTMVIQRGCCFRGGGAPAPVTQQVLMGDVVTTNDGFTTLETSGFAGCIGVILIGPGNTRTLAHISSWNLIQHPPIWNKLGILTAAAGVAHTAHIYHALTGWQQGDRGMGDQFLLEYGLNAIGTIIFHGAPKTVSVDSALIVTP